MSEYLELYQELILEHSKNPRNANGLKVVSHKSEGYNPLCGDQINLELLIEDNIIKDVGVSCAGCAISKASASIMSELVKGKTVKEAAEIFDKFHTVVAGSCDGDCHEEASLEHVEIGDLVALSGVKNYPVRVKCATLSWHALSAAIKKSEESVSTE